MIDKVFSKFLISGVLNTGVTYALYLVLLFLGFNYNVALAIVYIIGIILGFWLNKHWTFSSTAGKSKFIRYLVCMMCVFLTNFALLNLIISADIAGPVLGQLVALGIVTLLSYYLQKRWVFR